MQAPRWRADIRPIGNLHELAADWLQIQARSHCSFFQSWHWVEPWIRTLPKTVEPLCFRLVADELPVAIAVVVRSGAVRHGIIRSRRLYFGETGDSNLDAITVEYGGPLVDTSFADSAPREIIASFLRGGLAWDEMYLPGVSEKNATLWTKAAGGLRLRVRVLDAKPCYTVDLRAFEDLDGYLSSLSSNTRQQLRRSIRGYEANGRIGIDDVSSEKGFEQHFDEMKRLHQKYWRQKGYAGAFGSEYQNRFHDELVARMRGQKSLQLLRVRCAEATIGYLYNFVWRDMVYCYQSGFDYPKDNAKLKPGLVCHGLAIDFNREKGASVYNFLAGDSRYKRSLSGSSSQLTWPVLQKGRLRFKIETLFSRLLGS